MNANYLYSGISGWFSDRGVQLNTTEAADLLQSIALDLGGDTSGVTIETVHNICNTHNVVGPAAETLLAKVESVLPVRRRSVPTWAIVAGAAVVLLLVLKR